MVVEEFLSLILEFLKQSFNFKIRKGFPLGTE